MSKKLVMVMGVQRSGTTALFRSLALDWDLIGIDESDEKAFDNFFLKPEQEIRPILNALPGAVLLKPISETFIRSVADVFEEYKAYDLKVIWIYRDPIKVFYSRYIKGWVKLDTTSIVSFIRSWNRRNSLMLQCLPVYSSEIAIVSYDDLITDSQVFYDLCDYFDLHGMYLFRQDSSTGRKNLSKTYKAMIDVATFPVLNQLKRARRFKPQQVRLTSSDLPTPTEKETPDSNNMQKASEILPSQVDSLCLWGKAHDSSDYRNGESVHRPPINGPDIYAFSGIDGSFIRPCCINDLPAIQLGIGQLGKNVPESAQPLEIGTGKDWKFLYDGSEFTVFCVFRPSALDECTWDRQWTVLLSTEAALGTGPGFAMGWMGDLRATYGSILPQREKPVGSSGQSVVWVFSHPESYPPGKWRIATCRHKQQKDGKNLSITMGSNLVYQIGRKRPDYEYDFSPTSGGGLYLGNNPLRPDLSFHGQVAELIIFRQALNNDTRMGVTSYLQRKYALGKDKE